jgi:hypothetical protein
MLMPGVVSHAITLVEHSVLVADRIRATPRSSAARTSLRARIAASAAGSADLAGIKLRTLVKGARLAATSLWL